MPTKSGAHSDCHVLREIMLGRATCRQFSPAEVATDEIESMLEVGMHAPYALLPVIGQPDFRRFFVAAGSSPAFSRIREAAKSHVERMLPKLEARAAGDEAFSTASKAYRERLRGGFRFPECPWLVIIAERTGFPEVAAQSIAHCAQNMWLMASSRGLGVQLLSVFEGMGRDAVLCETLGVNVGEWHFLACAIGHPAVTLVPGKRPDVKQSTRWL